MAEDETRNLRRLAKRHRITFRLPSDAWPEAHASTFRNITDLGDRRFEAFSDSVSIRSQDEPWTRQTKHRAEWLAKRAGRLAHQQRNEAGWRFGLENDVFRRFEVEVACPYCRARVWRSEIEASLDQSAQLAEQLEQRRKDRKHCQCLPESRPQDYYEVGTNPLFDYRTEEVIVHDAPVKAELPNQRPDRVYGLQATKNFDDILSRPAAPSSTRTGRCYVTDAIRSSPFRSESDPLLFPFLILEAKSGSSSNDFDSIQAQTAFPIRALIRLQDDLQSCAGASENGTSASDRGLEPLVWFVANRGTNWRVYGCYLTRCADEEHPRYNILPLWDGSVVFKDKALQLILIVDYILDWARDVYRPTILKLLKSLTSGKPYDQVSMTNVTDIFSMRRNIADWIPAPPTAVDDLNVSDDLEPSVVTVQHENLLPIPIPNTRLGTVRSASLVDFRFVCLCLTAENVSETLRLLGQTTRSPDRFEERTKQAAKQIVNFVTHWDELLTITGKDLDELEYAWTGTSRYSEDSRSESSETFFVVMEYRCVISSSWDVTKELTCLAISESAFRATLSQAGWENQPACVGNLPKILRPCPGEILRDCVECLRSGSPWEGLLSAVSSTLVSLHPVPFREEPGDFRPLVEGLGFGYLCWPRVKPFIWNFLKVGVAIAKGRSALPDVVQSLTNVPFARLSQRKSRTFTKDSHSETCSRCKNTDEKEPWSIGYRWSSLHVPPHQSILVEAMDEIAGAKVSIMKDREAKSSARARHDICLFVVGDVFDATTTFDLLEVIPKLLERNHVCHTFLHHVSRELEHTYVGSGGPRPWLWNLPDPFRPCTPSQRATVLSWVEELHGRNTVENSRSRNEEDQWEHVQMLLHLMFRNESFETAQRYMANHTQRVQIGDRRYCDDSGFPRIGRTLRDLYRKKSDNPQWSVQKPRFPCADSPVRLYKMLRGDELVRNEKVYRPCVAQ